MNDTYFGEAFGVAAANAAVKGAEPDNDALFEGWLGRVLPSPGAKVLSRNAAKSFQSGCTISGDKARITGITLRMAVSQDYAAGDYQTNSIPKRVTDAVTRINGIISDNAARSDLDKLNAYADEICGLVEYNWPAVEDDLPYGDPWQLVCIFDGDPDTKVVCEGYSKGLKYLIDLSTFQDSRVGCVLMIGDLSDLGGHMWNVISMPDGRYYLADMTNCDGGDHCTGTLFLKASTGNAGGPYKCGGLTYTLYDSIKARFGADSPWLKLSRADYGEEEPPEPSTEINPDWTALQGEINAAADGATIALSADLKGFGGGVYINSGDSFTFSGGEICNNTAVGTYACGGGIEAYGAGAEKRESNLHYSDKLYIDGKLESGAKIGVSGYAGGSYTAGLGADGNIGAFYSDKLITKSSATPKITRQLSDRSNRRRRPIRRRPSRRRRDFR